jgi:hypothetical protein
MLQNIKYEIEEEAKNSERLKVLYYQWKPYFFFLKYQNFKNKIKLNRKF